NQDLLAAGALHRGSEWAFKSDGVQKLVLLAVVRILRRHALDEIVVDEGESKNVIARWQIQAHLLFRIGIEIDQLGRLGLDGLALEEFAIHPEPHIDWLRVLTALARETDVENVFGVPLDEVC